MSKSPIFLLIFFPYLLWAQPPQESLQLVSSSVKKLLEKGRAAEQQRDYLNAELAYLSAWEREKDNPAVRVHLEFLYRTTFQFSRIRQLEEKSLLIEAIVYRLYQDTIPLVRRPEAILAEFPDADDQRQLDLIRANPRHAEAYFTLGKKLFASAGWEAEATHYLKSAIELSPNNREARRMLALLYQGIGQYGKSEVQFKRLLESGLQSHRALKDLTSLYDQWSRPAALESILRETLGKFPDDQTALNRLGILLEEQGRYVEAEQLYHQYFPYAKDPEKAVWSILHHYQRCLERYPDSLQFHRAIGEWYYQMTYPELSWIDAESLPFSQEERNFLAGEGTAHLSRLLREMPNHPEGAYIHFQLGRLHQFRKEMDKSIPHLQSAVQGLKEKTDATFLLIDAYYATNQLQICKDSLEALHSRLELDYQHDLMLAKLRALAGEYEDGLKLTDKIIGYYNAHLVPVETYQVKGFILDMLGREEEAILALRKAIKTEEPAYGDYYHIGKLILRQAKVNDEPVTLQFEEETRDWPSRTAYGMTWIDGALVKGLPKRLLLEDPDLEYLHGTEAWQDVLQHY